MSEATERLYKFAALHAKHKEALREQCNTLDKAGELLAEYRAATGNDAALYAPLEGAINWKACILTSRGLAAAPAAGCTYQDVDGCCLHQGNPTPECYPDTCRLRAAAAGRLLAALGELVAACKDQSFSHGLTDYTWTAMVEAEAAIAAAEQEQAAAPLLLSALEELVKAGEDMLTVCQVEGRARPEHYRTLEQAAVAIAAARGEA